MKAMSLFAAHTPFPFLSDASSGRLVERVDYLDVIHLNAGDSLFHERDDSGYTKAVWVVRADGTRESVQFRLTRG